MVTFSLFHCNFGHALPRFGHEVKAENKIIEKEGSSKIIALADVCLDLVRPGMNFARFVGSIHASQSAHRSSKTGIGRLSSLFVRLDLNIDGILDSLELSVIDGPLKSCGRSADLAMASQGISDIL